MHVIAKRLLVSGKVEVIEFMRLEQHVED